jgi:hypothetical protein
LATILVRSIATIIKIKDSTAKLKSKVEESYTTRKKPVRQNISNKNLLKDSI